MGGWARLRKPSKLFGVGVASIALAAACSSSAAPAASRSTSSSTTTSASATTPSTPSSSGSPDLLDGRVDIGGDRHIFVHCAGTGSPTILLEAGDEDGTSSWGRVFPTLSNSTRTCAYDRVGNEGSSPATGCRELGDILADLEALLRTASIEGPFVLVGHSGGGFLMAAFAARHPSDVAGMVLVETPKAITILPPELEAALKCDAPTNIEHRDYVMIERAVWNAKAPIGDFPMTIISNDFGPNAPANDDIATNVEDQRAWLVLSPKSKQVVVTSGHEVQNNEPDVVIREVRAVLDMARDGA
jgi:hypothetical protein